MANNLAPSKGTSNCQSDVIGSWGVGVLGYGARGLGVYMLQDMDIAVWFGE